MQIEKYRLFMEGYVQFMEEMAAGEGEKYSALLSYDPKRIDRAVSTQQALNMKLAKLEEQREAEQKAIGLEGLTFQQIIDRLEGEEREQLRKLFSRFQIALNEVKFSNAKCISFAQEGMKLLGLQEEEVAAPYSSDGKRPESGQGSTLFEAKV